MNEAKHTILILGATGFFGRRIAAALCQVNGIRLLIASRRLVECRALATSLNISPENAVQLDISAVDISITLSQFDVNTVIHAAGPFQNQDFGVARAAIKARCNYIDLADARDFVAGIEELHQLAYERNVTVISGASSVPALSSAVVEKYRHAFKTLETIRVGIASGARAPGIATVKGIFGYCGKPIRRLERSVITTTYGWLDLYRHSFPPPVGKRWMSSCEVPDLELFPKRFPSLKTVTFHAGFASDVGHLVVWSLSSLVKAGLLRSVSPFAGALSRLSHWIEPLVSDKGAMFVTLEGLNFENEPTKMTWNLLASQNHGPHIPCGAAIALAQKIARGDYLPKGAMPCIGLLTIEEYLAPLRNLDIREVPP